LFTKKSEASKKAVTKKKKLLSLIPGSFFPPLLHPHNREESYLGDLDALAEIEK